MKAVNKHQVLVKDLREDIKEEVLKLAKEQKFPARDETSLAGAFVWALTPQGYAFWEVINQGKFEAFDKWVAFKKELDKKKKK